ncbi:MAG: hypothetical protein WCL02_07145 [bacterium]
MTTPQPIDLSVIDAKELQNLKKRQEKIDRVMGIIHENELDKDKEFMNEIDVLMEALLEEKD